MKITSKNKEQVGAYLREKRIEKGVSSYDMLMTHRIQHNTMKSIEEGGNYTMKALIRYCEAIGVAITLI